LDEEVCELSCRGELDRRPTAQTWYSRSRSGGNFCPFRWTRRSERKQSFDGGDAAASSQWNQRDRPGLAVTGDESQTGARAVTRCHRTRSTGETRRGSFKARKNASTKTSAPSRPEAANSGIETQARRNKKTSKPSSRLIAGRILPGNVLQFFGAFGCELRFFGERAGGITLFQPRNLLGFHFRKLRG
jgi:hypothetical protein